MKLRSARREPSRLLKDADSEYLPKKLRWISLHGFPSEYLPKDFCLHDTVAVDVKHSLLRFIWKEPQVFIKLLFVSTYNYFVLAFSSLIFYQKLSS